MKRIASDPLLTAVFLMGEGEENNMIALMGKHGSEDMDRLAERLRSIEVPYVRICLKKEQAEQLKDRAFPVLVLGRQFMFEQEEALELIGLQPKGSLIYGQADYAAYDRAMALERMVFESWKAWRPAPEDPCFEEERLRQLFGDYEPPAPIPDSEAIEQPF